MGKFNFKDEDDFVKVVVKQIDSGQKFFWSIIPFWKIDLMNSGRVLHSGNLEHD